MQIQVTVDIIRLGSLVAALALAALPAGAVAAPYVPPGNSAATQYTEAVPTAGGPKATDKGKQGKSKSPSKVLGSRNTAKLDAQGPRGRATAELAAATAPVETGGTGSAQAGTPPAGGSGKAGGQGSQGTGSNDGTAGEVETGNAAAQAGKPQAQNPSGSSGLGEVIGHATGSSSTGQLGLLLPLLVVAVVIWSVAYLVRQRRDRPIA